MKFVSEVIVVVEDSDTGNCEVHRLFGKEIMEKTERLYVLYTIGGRPSFIETDLNIAEQVALPLEDCAIAYVQGPPLGHLIQKYLGESVSKVTV